MGGQPRRADLIVVLDQGKIAESGGMKSSSAGIGFPLRGKTPKTPTLRPDAGTFRLPI
jgi:hypothetical protein